MKQVRAAKFFGANDITVFQVSQQASTHQVSRIDRTPEASRIKHIGKALTYIDFTPYRLRDKSAIF